MQSWLGKSTVNTFDFDLNFGVKLKRENLKNQFYEIYNAQIRCFPDGLPILSSELHTWILRITNLKSIC